MQTEGTQSPTKPTDSNGNDSEFKSFKRPYLSMSNRSKTCPSPSSWSMSGRFLSYQSCPGRYITDRSPSDWSISGRSSSFRSTSDQSCTEYLDDLDLEDEEVFSSFEDPVLYPAVEADLEKLQQEYGEGVVGEVLLLPPGCDISISLSLENDIPRLVSEAWGLIYGEPIIIELSFSQENYPISFNTYYIRNIEVKVHQNSKGMCYSERTCCQIISIIKNFCKQIHDQERKVKTLMDICIGSTCEETLAALIQCKHIDNEEIQIDEAISILTGESPSFAISQYLDFSQGFLVCLYKYIVMRIKTLNEHCILCDSKHVNGSQSMLQPVICNNEVCKFSLQSIGVNANINYIVKKQSDMVNLLILFTKAAAMSLEVNPYPIIYHKSSNDLAFGNGESKAGGEYSTYCTQLLKKVIDRIPSDLQSSGSEKELRARLEYYHELCYPLIRWIINTNSSYIVSLPREKRLSFMVTNYQYLLKNTPPVKDKIFRDKKEMYGSVFAFHGSPIYNWHSIVRRGLLNCSGTKMQQNGAAYGPGIYLSTDSSLSFTYCKRALYAMYTYPNEQTSGGKDFCLYKSDPSKMICLSLCEIINDERKLRKHNRNIWTCIEEDNVCTRFFFVYHIDGTCPTIVLDSQSKDISNQIRALTDEHL